MSTEIEESKGGVDLPSTSIEELSFQAKVNLAKIDELNEFMHEITTDAVEVAEKMLSIC